MKLEGQLADWTQRAALPVPDNHQDIEISCKVDCSVRSSAQSNPPFVSTCQLIRLSAVKQTHQATLHERNLNYLIWLQLYRFPGAEGANGDQVLWSSGAPVLVRDNHPSGKYNCFPFAS